MISLLKWRVNGVRGSGLLSAAVLAIACVNCSSDEAANGGATGSDVCGRLAKLATARGCSARNCSVHPACESQYHAWVDCIARDLSQCICETDGDFNCEGSWKPDEGPALCISQHDAAASCTAQQPP